LDPGADPNTTTTPDVVHTGNFSSDSRPARACVRPFDFNCDGNEVPDPLPAPFDFCDEAAGCLVSPGARRNLGPGDPGCGEPYELVLCAVDDTGFCGEIGALPAVQNCL
jgi:hypothetical protein